MDGGRKSVQKIRVINAYRHLMMGGRKREKRYIEMKFNFLRSSFITS